MAQERATRKIALVDRHGTTKDWVSVRANERLELHGSNGMIHIFENVDYPAFNDDDSHTTIAAVFLKHGGRQSAKSVMELAAKNHKEKTMTNALWDLSEEYGLLDRTTEGGVTFYRANHHLALAWEDRRGAFDFSGYA